MTLVVSRLAGTDKPIMLLTNLSVENLKYAKRLLRYYIRRWEREEGIRFLKSQVNLEKIRTFRWSTIRRLVLLAILVMIYLGWLVEAHPNICARAWVSRVCTKHPSQHIHTEPKRIKRTGY